jgi:hypothetical protein
MSLVSRADGGGRLPRQAPAWSERRSLRKVDGQPPPPRAPGDAWRYLADLQGVPVPPCRSRPDHHRAIAGPACRPLGSDRGVCQEDGPRMRVDDSTKTLDSCVRIERVGASVPLKQASASPCCLPDDAARLAWYRSPACLSRYSLGVKLTRTSVWGMALVPRGGWPVHVTVLPGIAHDS